MRTEIKVMTVAGRRADNLAAVRIGLFAHRLAEAEATGVGRYMRQLVGALAEEAPAQVELVLASAARGQGRPDWVAPRLQVHSLPWPRRPVHAAWSLGTGPRVERALGRLDVLHLLYPFPPVRSTAPQVVTVHDVMPLKHPDWFPRSERIVYRRLMHLARRRASRIVVPSRYVSRDLVATTGIDPARVVVVPLGAVRLGGRGGADIDARAVCARFGVDPGGFVVCLGAVSTRKNLVPVIRGMARLGADGPPLLIVGPDGYGAQHTEVEIGLVNDRAQVRRTGYVSDEDVAALIKSARVVVHPALEEGFGLVPLEAMSAGTPVIAARVSAIPEVVGDAAWLIDDPQDPGAWAAAIRALASDDELRLRLAAAGRRRATGFSWRRTATTMLGVYAQAAGVTSA